MKTRYSLNERGELEDRDGNVLGSVTSLTLDSPERGDYRGGFSFLKNRKEKTENNPIAPSTLEVWEHYVKVFDASRQELNAQRRRHIERALKVRDAETVKAAISGLRVSPHHNGRNEQNAKYLDIRYALRGIGTRGESDEERIDRMAGLAASPPSSPTTRDRGVLEGRISSLKADIRRCANARYELTEEYLAQRDEAIRDLHGFGILVTLDEHGWPSYEDIS